MESTSPVPFMTVKVVVVRSGPAELGKWITETRNVYEDYRKLYGDERRPSAASGCRSIPSTRRQRRRAILRM